jgi:rod shape-determining protein MreD
MIKKILIFIILFYFLALIQTSFMVHFSVWGLIPNLIFLLVIVWNIFEKSKNNLGIYQAATAGFFIDIFSSRVIGFNVMILIFLAIIIKLFLKSYVRIPFLEE